MRSDSGPGGQRDESDLFSFIGNARRQQIKAAAVDTIVELGYAKASLARIAEHAGVSKGVISYHFAGKDELMEKLVVEFYLAAAHHVIAHLEAETTARGTLRAYIESNVEYITENRQGILAVIDIISNFRTTEGRLRFGPEGNRELIEAVAGILRGGQDSGEFGEFDPWVVAASLRASIDMVSEQLSADPNLDTARYARELAGFFDRATRKESP